MKKAIKLLKYWKNKNLTLVDAFRVAFTNEILEKPVRIIPLALGSPIFLRGKGSSDVEVFREICVSKEYDVNFDFPVTRIIDAGANCGISSLFFKQKYPEAEIVAVEPEPSNVSALRNNTRMIEHICVYPNALHGRKCKIRIENPDSERQWAFTTTECFNSESSVETVTIPEIMNEKCWDYVDILKIDIEGGEIELFTEGDLEWIGHVNVIIIELHDWIRKGCSQAFFESLCAIDGYDFSMSGESVIITRRNLLTQSSNRVPATD